MHDRVVELVDDFGARNCRPRQWLQARLAVAVDHHAGRQWAQIRPVTGNEHDAEMLVPSCGRGDSSWRPILGTAVVARLLERGFLYRIRRALQVPACRPVRARVLRRAELADAAAEFVGVEMSVTAVDERRERAVGEGQKRGVRALGGTCRVPGAGQRAHARNVPAAQEADDVDLMRALAEHDPAAARGRELLGSARTIEKIGVVLGVDHPHAAHRSAGDDLARAQDGAIEAVAVADDQKHVGTLGRVDHAATLFERDRHRFLDQRVLAARGRQRDVRGVMLMRRSDVNHFDAFVGAELVDRRVHPRAEVRGEAPGRFGARVCRGNQLEARIRGQRGEHQRERAPQTGDADAQSAFRHIGSPFRRRAGLTLGPSTARMKMPNVCLET